MLQRCDPIVIELDKANGFVSVDILLELRLLRFLAITNQLGNLKL